LLTILIFSAPSALAGASAPKKLKDLHFGEALYYAFQDDWFGAIARLDTELMQHYGVDEPNATHPSLPCQPGKVRRG